MITTKRITSVTSAVMAVLFALLLVCSMPLPASAEALTGKTASELMAELDLGWNLGNTLDATGGSGLDSETSWGNPKTSKAMIDAVKAQGFNTVRVPVSWGSHMTNKASGYVIDSAWMARVKEIVDYCIDNDMYVILNIHHDNDIKNNDDRFFYPSDTYKEQSLAFVEAVWEQISATFKNYDQHLIFETLNEPRLVGTGDEWWFPVNSPNTNVTNAISIINDMNQKAVDTIRASGGNNAERCIMIPGYGASIDGCTTPNYTLPTDTAQNRLIVSVHAYTPYNFALNASGTSVFSDDLKSEVDYLFNTLKSSFLDKNIPVVIGEASASNKNNASERLKWVNYYMGKSSALNIPVMLWDNNVYSGSSNLGEQHGYLNRLALTWYDKDVVDAMVACYGNTPSGDNGNGGDDNNDDNNVTTDSTVLFTGSASADAWAQATSVMTIKNNGGTLNPAIITEDGYFYVEYTGDIGKIELIMQSWSGGTEWAKIGFSESGMAGNNYYAKFSYADCVAAFGEDFATYLDCVYIGATDGSITALSLSYVSEAEEVVTPLTKPVVTATAGDKQVTLSWNAVEGADYYQVIRYKNGVYSLVVAIKDTSVTVKGLTNDFDYAFLVKAVNENDSALSTAVWVTPKAPITLKATPGDKQATLSWTAVNDAKYYQIIRYKEGTYSKVADISGTSAVVKGLANNFEYTYLIKAVLSDGTSVLSNAVRVTPVITLTAPVLTAKAGDKQVTLSWTAVNGAEYYQIIRYKNGTYSVVANISGTSAVVKSLTNNFEYTYLVKAVGNNASSLSNAVWVTPTA